ncbi:ABC transporter substrate-binding protein [Tianweitania sediminis]|uniref:ABC transporter substrate-binding protein n=1 Tax=Tianweitania sediminis TaxID=1502156 RepID=A0A8J7RSD9_9HYPH|nr:ABC transporter substrate-binding protein [Tianweitania sediminis]MBP0441159.1 ABC transporter substrate-binding protein [Tianweitania sediminis]
MMISRRIFLGTVLAGTMLASAPSWAQETFKVGVINPFSGPTALYGDEVTRGYELAADAVNKEGGILGKQVELIRGNATAPQEGIAAVEQLAGRDNVDVFIGTYLSAVAQAASEAALNYNKLYWDTNALAANLTERGLPNFVRSGPFSQSFADRSAEFITELVAKELGKQPSELKVWIEHEESIYGTSIADRQKEALEKAGVQVVGVGAHNFKAIDLTDSILRARDAKPDVYLNTGYVPDGNLLLRTARDQGFKPAAMVFVGTGDTKETLEAMGEAGVEGLYVVSYPRPDISEEFGPGSSAYLEAYKAKYNAEPLAPQSMAAFVGFKMMAEAVNAAESAEPEAVRAALAEFDKPESSYETGFGVKYNENAQNTRAFPTVVQWQSGKPVTIYPVAAAGENKTVKAAQ